MPANDSTVFAKQVELIFSQFFQPGVRYYKAGIGAIELEDDMHQQIDMFNVSDDKPELMQCLDTINKRYGSSSLRIATELQSNQWQMKRDWLSQRYTTRWSEIPLIKCQ